MGNYEFFKKEFEFHGKHARMAGELWVKGDYEHTCFRRLIDLYMVAAVVGFRVDRKAKEDFSPFGTKSILAEQVINAKEELDFIMMMGNLLDNAIESAVKCRKGERYIVFKIYNINDIFGIKIKNSSISKPTMVGDDFLTEKKEKDIHGWGIKSVKKILEKYNGELNFKYDNSFFETHVIIEDDISIMENIYEK